MSDELYDVAVIGAGPAGAQAAISACHQTRHVLVIDAGEVSRREGRAYWSKSVEFEDVPVFDKITGPKFKKALREWMEARPVQEVSINGEPRKHGIEIRGGFVMQLTWEDDRFLLETSMKALTKTGEVTVIETLQAKRVVIASGFEDKWPQIEVDEDALRLFDQYKVVFRYAGNRAGWHVCVRCDGHLHIDQPLAVLGVGDYIYETAFGAQDFTENITILTNGRPHGISEPVLRQIKERGMTIDERKIKRHIGKGTELLGFEMEDGDELYFHGFFVDEGLEPNTPFLEGWDVKRNTDGLIVCNEDRQALDSKGEPIFGMFVAGDLVAGERNLIATAFALGQDAGLAATDSLRKWEWPSE